MAQPHDDDLLLLIGEIEATGREVTAHELASQAGITLRSAEEAVRRLAASGHLWITTVDEGRSNRLTTVRLKRGPQRRVRHSPPMLPAHIGQKQAAAPADATLAIGRWQLVLTILLVVIGVVTIVVMVNG